MDESFNIYGPPKLKPCNSLNNLGSTLLCTYCTLLMMINWWKKWKLVEIKCYSNENIEWHCMQFQFKFKFLDLIQILYDSTKTLKLNPKKIIYFEFYWIQFKFKWKEMGCKVVKKVLKICSRLWCWKMKTMKDIYPKRLRPFHYILYLGIG
jgi:hypothetical protein